MSAGRQSSVFRKDLQTVTDLMVTEQEENLVLGAVKCLVN